MIYVVYLIREQNVYGCHTFVFHSYLTCISDVFAPIWLNRADSLRVWIQYPKIDPIRTRSIEHIPSR